MKTLPLPLLALLAIAAESPDARCQEYLDTAGRWKTLNTASWSGLGTDFVIPDPDGVSVFFRDSLHGYIRSRGPVWRSTTNGGRTWATRQDTVPMPHRIDGSGFGIAPDGHVSRDSGATWRVIGVDGTTRNVTAWDRNRMAVRYDIAGLGERLAATTDAGMSWIRIDSVDAGGGFALNGPFGPLPIPAMFTAPNIGWVALGEFESPTRFSAILAVGQVGVGEARFYAAIDLATRSIQWTRMEDWHQQARILGGGVLWDLVYELDSATNKTLPTWLRISVDSGASWDSSAVPSWLNGGSLRGLDRRTFVATNAFTTDGGATWRPVVHHYYGSNVREWPVDTSTFVVAAPYSLFAISNNGGRTWRQNAAGAVPTSVVGCDGRVVVGRNWRSALFSPDSGETWTELGSIGALPEYLTTIWALAYPDSVNEPLRVLGVGGFHFPDRHYEVHIIESSDGGRTWADGVRVPELEKGLGPFEALALVPMMTLDQFADYALRNNAISFTFARNVEGSGTTGFIAVQRSFVRSTDGGRSWTETCDSIAFARLKMADSRRGVAASVLTIRSSAAIYSTDDGGITWTWRRGLYVPAHYPIEVGWLGGARYQILCQDMNVLTKLYSFRSDDNGVNWRQDFLTRSGVLAAGDLLWLDTADIHSVHAGGEIYHTTNGGESFTRLHPRLSPFAGISTGFDGSYLYLVSEGNVIGRWRIARRARRVSAIADEFALAGALVIPNPAGDVAFVHVPATDRDVRLVIADALGRIVVDRTSPPPSGRSPGISIDLTAVSPGAYFVTVTSGEQRYFAQLIVEGR